MVTASPAFVASAQMATAIIGIAHGFGFASWL
jgi:hypothetical protein